MGINDSAEKLRRAAERPQQASDAERRKSDVEAAETQADLTEPDHSKARPLPGDVNGRRPSNAGNDGP
jgi:hypothetical protein